MSLWAIPCFALGIGGWLLAAVSAAELAMRHPAEDRSAWWYATHGAAFFDPEAFAASGAPVHSRMLAGMGTFVTGIGAGMLVTALTAPA
ncbi:MAG: hypothetical protein EP330_31120 [Deltaproteobacteria bacterium]|nr:MAG: hypothetical protein EP330_31120 [Deltaproteobacteria bacterium]